MAVALGKFLGALIFGFVADKYSIKILKICLEIVIDLLLYDLVTSNTVHMIIFQCCD
jgi:hypothetical protein